MSDSPNLKEAIGAKLEADNATEVEVTYGDETYTFPASLDDCDGDVLEAIDDRKQSYTIRALLGPDQYKRFKKTKPKVRDYEGLFDAFAERIGLETSEK